MVLAPTASTSVCCGVLLVCFVSAQPLETPDRVIGLLTLPEVFGKGPCDDYTPTDVPLYTAPNGAPAGTIRVVTPWIQHAEGGCGGLEVRVQGPESNDLQPLPVEEYEYEAEAAIVLERAIAGSGCAWPQGPRGSTRRTETSSTRSSAC